MTDCESESDKHCTAVTGDWESEIVRRKCGGRRSAKSLVKLRGAGWIK